MLNDQYKTEHEQPQPTPSTQKPVHKTMPRLADLTILKGIGILFVVFGHLSKGSDPQVSNWYIDLRTLIYSFHMPLFLYISGFLVLRTRPERTDWNSTLVYIKSRARRLLIPFMVFGLLLICGKHLSYLVFKVDGGHTLLSADLYHLFVHTELSGALSVWYLAVTFILGAVVLIYRMFINSILVLFLFTILLSFFEVSDFFYMDRVVTNSPFFVAGIIAAQYEQKWLSLVEKHVIVFGIVFAYALTISRYLDSYNVALILCGFTSMPFFHGLSRKIVASGRYVTLLNIGFYSMSIYLLNTIIIGVLKAVWIKVGFQRGLNFELYVVVGMILAVYLPVAIKQHLFRRVDFIDGMTN